MEKAKKFPDLPKLTPESTIKLDVLMDLFFQQLMTFSHFINEKPLEIDDWKYADVVIYMLQWHLDELKKKRRLSK